MVKLDVFVYQSDLLKLHDDDRRLNTHFDGSTNCTRIWVKFLSYKSLTTNFFVWSRILAQGAKDFENRQDTGKRKTSGMSTHVTCFIQ